MVEGRDGRGFRFCPRRGGAFNSPILQAGDPARLVCDRCGFIVYLDPKVAVGTIIRTADHQIVLCRRGIEPGYGRWVFPGGYVDRGEKLEVAAVREAREECGLDVPPTEDSI
jgi:NADH pyrophosphatase NudC (nudix superfamily)